MTTSSQQSSALLCSKNERLFRYTLRNRRRQKLIVISLNRFSTMKARKQESFKLQV